MVIIQQPPLLDSAYYNASDDTVHFRIVCFLRKIYVVSPLSNPLITAKILSSFLHARAMTVSVHPGGALDVSTLHLLFDE